MATSLSTVYLAFDINHAQDWGTGFLFSSETAELILHVIEPIQIGYGAVVRLFLLGGITTETDVYRSYRFLAPFTGVLSGQNTAATMATDAMPME